MEKRKILIAGGSGLIGSHLSWMLKKQGYEVALLSRKAQSDLPYKIYIWNPESGQIDPDAFRNVYAVINLAGANVAGGLWTKGFKKKIYDSRIRSTALLVKAIENSETKPVHFIQGAAVGYYPSDDELKSENSKPGDKFLAEVCKNWEAEALKAEASGCKVSIIRTGIVLANTGGFLDKVRTPVSLRLGTVFGHGKQLISWIHIHDLSRIFHHILQNTLPPGIYNGVSPNPKTNREMMNAIAFALKKPIILPPVPAFVLRLTLGEFSTELLSSHRISAEKLLQAGFGFQFPDLPAALEDLIAPR